jgi:hypothetical protein
MLTRCRQGAIVAATALTVGLAACSSSTAPAPETASQLAEHFDSIYASLIAGATGADSMAAFDLAILIEDSPAYGSLDAPFTITTTTGTQTWRGVTFEIAPSDGDSTFITAVYNNRNLGQVIYVEQDYANNVETEAFGGATTNLFQSIHADSVATGSASLVSTGAACTQQSGLQADAFFTSLFNGGVCESAKFNISFSMTFPDSTAGALGSLTAVSATNATFTGPRFSVSDGQHVAPIPSRTAAMLMRVQAMLHREH